MRKRIKTIISVVVALSFFAAVIPFTASGASQDAALSRAAEMGIISEGMLSKANSSVTRKEFASMVLGFYRSFTGFSGLTLTPSPFHDDTSVNAATVYELGIMDGMSDNMFGPNSYVSREEMAQYIINALIACGVYIDTDGAKKTSKSWFSDIDSVSTDYLKAVYILADNNVLYGYSGGFYPKTYVSVSQVANALVRAYDNFKTYGISVGDNEIKLRDKEEDVVNALGEPDKKGESQFGTKRYVYSSNLENFIIIGFKDGMVAELFTNASKASYMGVDCGAYIEDINVFGEFSSQTSGKMVIKKYRVSTTLLFSYIEGRQHLDYVYIKDSTLVSKPGNYNMQMSEFMTYELCCIINSARAVRGLEPLQINENLQKSAKAHSLDMKGMDKASYTGSNGKTSTERIKSVSDYYICAENVLYTSGDAVNIYEKWVTSVGNAGVMFSSAMINSGIGISVNGSKVFAVMDVYSEIQ